MGKKFLLYEEIDKIIDDDSIYSEDVRDRLVDDDEISPEEAGFMEGYDKAYV
jgi:hypothetical protein